MNIEKLNKELQSFMRSDMEIRNIGSVRTDDNYIVEGYAATFDRYKLYEIDGEEYYEQIDQHAFDTADLSDVIFRRDHTGFVLARTSNGSVKLSVDTRGLFTRTDLSRTKSAKEMYEDIKAGNYRQMSFAFTVDSDYFDNKTNTRHISKIKRVYDISAVAFPANPYTVLGISNRDHFKKVWCTSKEKR